jgi:putative spermidine/putrescine transport system substrate-binding protein
MKSTAMRLGFALTACAALVVACSSSEKSGGNGGTPPKLEPLSAVGNGEGHLNIIAWAGYAEDGSNDKAVDWVTPFEQKTGCQVNVKLGNTSDEMVQLMRTGQYDGVSASGDATLRLIYAGDVSPVNTDLVPNYATISSFLKDKSWNSVDGHMYGIPHGRRVQGQGHCLRLPHLHRRCGAVPLQEQAGPGHQGPVLADAPTARRRSRIAQETARERQ